MKKFKLNYLAFSLIIAMTASCVNEAALGDADKANAEENNEFTFSEDIHNYEINGKLTYDRNAIAVAAENAWNVLYDYPNKKVFISTTPQELEKLKNRNAELKASFEKEPVQYNEQENLMSDSENNNTILTENTEKIIKSESSSKANVFAPAALDINAHYSENDSNDIVLHSHEFRKDGGKWFHYYTNVDLYTIPDTDKKRVYHSAGTAFNDGFKMHQYSAATRGFTSTAAYSKTNNLSNHSKFKRTITFYREKNYKGASKAYVLSPHTAYIVKQHVNFNPPGRPANYPIRVGAGSIKVK